MRISLTSEIVRERGHSRSVCVSFTAFQDLPPELSIRSSQSEKLRSKYSLDPSLRLTIRHYRMVYSPSSALQPDLLDLSLVEVFNVLFVGMRNV